MQAVALQNSARTYIHWILPGTRALSDIPDTLRALLATVAFAVVTTLALVPHWPARWRAVANAFLLWDGLFALLLNGIWYTRLSAMEYWEWVENEAVAAALAVLAVLSAAAGHHPVLGWASRPWLVCRVHDATVYDPASRSWHQRVEHGTATVAVTPAVASKHNPCRPSRPSRPTHPSWAPPPYHVAVAMSAL